MNHYDNMTLPELHETWNAWRKTYDEQVKALSARTQEIYDALVEKTYPELYYYVYEEYVRKPHHRLEKRVIVINSGDFEKDREKALDLCERFRIVRSVETKRSGIKYYHQVRLVNKLTQESYTIAGGEFYENLWGLAWEAAILDHSSLSKINTNYAVYNQAYLIKGIECFFPNKWQHNNPNSFYYPQILESQVEITFEYTLEHYADKNYINFLRGVAKFEKKSNQTSANEEK